MYKKDFVYKFTMFARSKRVDIDFDTVSQLYDIIDDFFIKQIPNETKFHINNVGTFHVVKRQPRVHRSIATGELEQLGGAYRLAFKAAGSLNKRVTAKILEEETKKKD